MKAKVNNLTILHITILHKFKMSARLQKNVTGKTNREFWRTGLEVNCIIPKWLLFSRILQNKCP